MRWVLFLVARVLVRQKKRRLGHKGGGGHVKTEAEMGRRGHERRCTRSQGKGP